MNIFILSEQINPQAHYAQQAEFHIDKHVVKMIAESVQIAVTVLSNLPEIEVGVFPCKPLGKGHAKHPCVEWASASLTNLNYVICLARALCKEHQYRYPLSPEHAYSAWITHAWYRMATLGYGTTAPLPTSFAVAVKDVSKRSTSVDHLQAMHTYRRYYFSDKAGFASWKKRQKPVWWILMEETI